MNHSLSVIVPLGSGETAWRELLPELLGQCEEILLVATESEPADWKDFINISEAGNSCSRVRWLESSLGRALQMNAGANAATREFLWFLHADSQVRGDCLDALQDSVQKFPHDVHYFDLQFHQEGPRLMKLNEWGVWIRSHWLGMPFGDQGLCLSAEQFQTLGGFDESASYGEDHLFVWSARLAGLKLRPVSASLSTSARKYQQGGWFKTTLKHVYLTWRQAIPMWFRLLKKRCAP